MLIHLTTVLADNKKSTLDNKLMIVLSNVSRILDSLMIVQFSEPKMMVDQSVVAISQLETYSSTSKTNIDNGP